MALSVLARPSSYWFKPVMGGIDASPNYHELRSWMEQCRGEPSIWDSLTANEKIALAQYADAKEQRLRKRGIRPGRRG